MGAPLDTFIVKGFYINMLFCCAETVLPVINIIFNNLVSLSVVQKPSGIHILLYQ